MVTCRTLLGHRNIEFSVDCLKSCLDNCLDPIVLEIFEDGTLTKQNIALINEKLPNSKIIHKSVRDKVLNEKLKAYPNSKEMRNLNVFGYKLFDIMLYEPRDFFYLDSDVVFFRKFRFPEFNGSPMFMKDAGNGYCFSDRMILKLHKNLRPKINAGFLHFPPHLFDLNFIENILSQYYTSEIMNHFWAEQTMWSFLASSQNNVYYFNPAQIVMPSSYVEITADLIAIHFVRAYRDRIPKIKKQFAEIAVKNNRDYQIGVEKIEDHLTLIPYLVLKYKDKLLRKMFNKF